jgi:ATP-dependent DNA helicase Q1
VTAGLVEKRDVSNYARDFIAILRNSQVRNQRMTGLKLVEAWLGKGSTALRLSQHQAPIGLDRTEAERIIVHLLLNGYLREDFHFTPYSTISYIVSGMAPCLSNDIVNCT